MGFNFNTFVCEVGCSSVAELLASDPKIAGSSPSVGTHIFSFIFFLFSFLIVEGNDTGFMYSTLLHQAVCI